MPKKNISKESEERLIELQIALNKNYCKQKKIMNEIRELMEELKVNLPKQEINQLLFLREQPVPKPLRKLLDIEEELMTKADVTDLLYQYFKEHDLCDKVTKEITPNKKIKKLFNMNDDDEINFYNLQNWLDKLYYD